MNEGIQEFVARALMNLQKQINILNLGLQNKEERIDYLEDQIRWNLGRNLEEAPKDKFLIKLANGKLVPERLEIQDEEEDGYSS